ncbi:cache domain-containing protein [Rhodomicrobium udaipurense]|uniref:Cache domain-containing protein n=1 Tax=Rhodomicrobium udaipurense TaxID=1202716 RepID=A0A8I1GDX1_9HYPH|nr:cache domain-containing protein [Rhodomicrobium udaipurense]MBJ7544140.1 cache domain-containing protein [Rhodomicrobium udaipurense]
MRRQSGAILAIVGVLGSANIAGAETVEEIAGRQVFHRCQACHSVDQGKLGFGPNLHGIVGRPAASLPTFVYSDGLKSSGLVWNEETLRKWISDNTKLVPGTRMRHVAITDRAEQDYLLAYLKAQSDNMGPAQAQVLLDRAVSFVEREGPQRAFVAFNDRANGGFVARELYVFVFDMKGRYMASGANPALTGTDALAMKDAEGKELVREMINIAQSAGSGEVDYVWLNRAENKVEHKRSFIRRVGDYIVGVGYYLN